MSIIQFIFSEFLFNFIKIEQYEVSNEVIQLVSIQMNQVNNFSLPILTYYLTQNSDSNLVNRHDMKTLDRLN